MPASFPCCSSKVSPWWTPHGTTHQAHSRPRAGIHTGNPGFFLGRGRAFAGLRAGGRQLGWGFQFQSPGFIAVMALLLFFLGLSLAGMFEIGLTVTNTGSSLAARQGYAGSFFTGVLAMVVATPCTRRLWEQPSVSPWRKARLWLLLSSPRWPSAWPRPIYCSRSIPLDANLPRPGAWMEVLKQATAAPIFATVIWLVWLFASSAGVDALTAC